MDNDQREYDDALENMIFYADDVVTTPEEVQFEYTYPQDFEGSTSWRQVLGLRLRYFRLLIDPSCTEIHEEAFYSCKLLVEIVFAENSCLTEIGGRAFRDCRNLQRMNALPTELLCLRHSAFIDFCSLPGELVIPSKVVLVEDQCFRNCGITSVVFNDNPSPDAGPMELGWSVFSKCYDLRSVRLPHNIDYIPENFFFGCIALINCPVPVSVEEIGEKAFMRCSALQSVDLPERTIRIGDQAYEKCTSLEQVTIRAIEAHYGRDVFTDCLALATIQVFPSLWTQLFESMQNDPSFLFHFVRKYQACKWTA